MKSLLADLAARHPSVGAVRSIGLFGIVELVRNRKTLEPMAPFNGTSPEMQALGKFFRNGGSCTRLCGGTRSSRIRRCASPKPSCARLSRSSIAGFTRSIVPLSSVATRRRFCCG